VNALSALAGYYVIVKDFSKSIECLQEALELNPESATLCVDIGNSYNALKQFDEAEKYYKRALTYNPDFAEYYYNKAIQVKDVSRPVDREQIGAYLDKSIEINPMFLPAHLTKAGLLYDEQKFEETITELTPLIDRSFHQDIIKAIALRGEAYRMLGQEPKALPDLLFVHIFQPDNIRNVFHIAATLSQMNFFNEAVYFANRGLQLGELSNDHTFDNVFKMILESIKVMSSAPNAQNSHVSEENNNADDNLNKKS
jgi:tetratricopeptide (TPR) repeat protein